MWSCTNDPLGGARCGFQNSRTESHAAWNTLYTDDISGNMKVCGNHYTVSETRIYFVSGMYCTYSYGETCSIHELAINNSLFTHVAPMKGSNQDFNIKWSGLLGTMGDILYSIGKKNGQTPTTVGEGTIIWEVWVWCWPDLLNDPTAAVETLCLHCRNKK